MRGFQWLLLAAVVLDIDERVVRYTVPGHDLQALRAALADQALAEEAGGSHGRTAARCVPPSTAPCCV